MNYLDGGRWLDGPRLAEWLGRYTEEWKDAGNKDSLTRRMYDWRNGASADINAIDHYLVKLSLHPADLPDSLWLAKGEGSKPAARGKCRRGHRLVGENVYCRPSGGLECLVCKRRRERQRRERAA